MSGHIFICHCMGWLPNQSQGRDEKGRLHAHVTTMGLARHALLFDGNGQPLHPMFPSQIRPKLPPRRRRYA